MIDGSEKCNGWLNLELESLRVIERHSKKIQIKLKLKKLLVEILQTNSIPN